MRECETRTLTTGDDTFVGTANNDTFNAASGTLSANDQIIDQSSSDSDTLNVTFKTADFGVVADVTGVENINVTIDAFDGTATTFDATDVSGATITLGSNKLGYNGDAGVTAAGDNNVTAGDNVDTLTVAGLESGVVNAGAASTVNITTLTAAAGEEINLTTNGDVDATVNFNGPATETLNLVAAAASVVTLNAASTVVPANLTVAGSGDLSIDTGAANVTGATVTGVDVLNIVNLTGGLDAENLTVGSIEVSDTAALAVTNANGQTVDLTAADAGLTVSGDGATGAAVTVNINADQDGSAGLTVDGVDSSVINVSDAVADIGTSLTIEGEATINVAGDLTIDDLVATNTTDTVVLAGSGDVTLTTTNVQSVDASGLTGALVIAATTAAESAIVGGSGDNDVTLANADSAFTGQSGNDTVNAAVVTSEDVAVESGAGDDVLVVDTSSGTIAYDGGAGTDTLAIVDAADLTTGSVSLVNVEAIQVTDSDAAAQNDMTATVFASTISGESLAVGTSANDSGVAADTAAITVEVAATDTVVDLSGLTLTNISGMTVDASGNTVATTITGSSTVDTITGSGNGDTISAGAGDDLITAGAGATTLTGGDGGDTFTFVANDSAEGAIASITDFDTAEFDVLGLDTVTIEADAGPTDVSGVTSEAGDTVTATIANGLMTLAGADAANVDTLAEWIDAAEVMTAASGGTAGVLGFEFDGNTYIVEDDAGTVNVIELTGVTGLDAVGTAAAADTLVIA